MVHPLFAEILATAFPTLAGAKPGIGIEIPGHGLDPDWCEVCGGTGEIAAESMGPMCPCPKCAAPRDERKGET